MTTVLFLRKLEHKQISYQLLGKESGVSQEKASGLVNVFGFVFFLVPAFVRTTPNTAYLLEHFFPIPIRCNIVEDTSKCFRLISQTVFLRSEFYRMLARLMPREIHAADVNAGYSLVECLREMEERRAKYEE